MTCPSVGNGGSTVILLVISGSAVMRKFSSDNADSLDSEWLVSKPLDSLDLDVSDSGDEFESSESELLLDSFDSTESES